LDPEFIRELFAQFRAVTVRRMFGGAGIFAEGLMFGLVFDGAIYLKVDAGSIPDFERAMRAVRSHFEERQPYRPPFAVVLAHARAALRRSR
jgi:DNA transformation protein